MIQSQVPNGITLTAEKMQVRFPTLRSDQYLHRDDARAHVAVHYYLHNDGAQRELPIEFLGLDLGAAEIRLNGQVIAADLAPQAVTDANYYRELLLQVIEHYVWESKQDWPMPHYPVLYQLCSERDESTCPQTLEAWRQLIAQMDTATLQQNALAFQIYAFHIALVPGDNILEVNYRQQLSFHEGYHDYFTDLGLDGAQMGFDYLLYPAESWHRSEQFVFDLEIISPPLIDVGWLWNSELPARMSTNMGGLTRDANAPIWRLSTPDFPVPVLSIRNLYR
ncbi:hypothetical protein [Vibrio stylophorae]|nr:hypothetical protein [Vibrio stylophorae]